MLQKNFERARALSVRKLDLKEWSILRDYHTGLNGRDTVAGDVPEAVAAEKWKSHMARYVPFALFDGDKVIGTTSVCFQSSDKASLTGFLITPEYRKQGLADHLYDAGKNHLKEIGFEGRVIVEIQAHNQPSMKAAQRNGFQRVSEKRVPGEGWANRLVILELT